MIEKKLLRYFKGTAIIKFFIILSAADFPKILDLYLNDN